jgi:exodeoxyribonuclease V beta subunit
VDAGADRWLDGVLRPAAGAGIALNQLSARDKQVEMAFYLPIEQPLDRCVWMR